MELTSTALYPDGTNVPVFDNKMKTSEVRSVRGATLLKENSPSRQSESQGLLGLSERLTGHSEKRRPMLTSSQLSDLFTRLDKNGDGELDLDEFTGIIKMLKIKVTPDYIARVFRSVDQAAGNSDVSGTLDMQEFIAAYQKIYCGATIEDRGAATAKRESFVRATRYGCQHTGNFVFECYTLPSSGANERFTLENLPNDSSILENVDITKLDMDHLKTLGNAKTEPFNGSVDDIVGFIREDSVKNKTHGATVLWWVDVAYTSVDRTTAEEIVTKFGLPNNSKFLSTFGNFGNGMPADPKSRVFAGIGNHTSGAVYSLSYFAQAMWIKSVPVVHHLPPWMRTWQCAPRSGYLSSVSDAMVQYYTSRFAWMANISWLAKTSADEKIGAYERAEGLASLLKNSDSDTYDDEEEEDIATHDSVRKDAMGRDRTDIFGTNGAGVPLRRRTGYDYPPTWLRSNTQLQRTPPQIQMDTLSMHILDQGYGANALLTVRQIDSEKQKGFTLEQQSRAGVLGRIISGVWVKLAEVTMRGRSTGIAGELTDSPASLVTFLLMLVHNFSMNSAASVDYWLNVLEKEIKDIVVSKHSAHLAEVERMLKEITSYLDPFEALMQTLSKEQETHAIEQAAAKELTSRAGSPEPPMIGIVHAKSGLQKHRDKRKALFPPGSQYTEALPENVEKVSLSFAHIHTFFGADPYREIRANLDGYELLDIKGLVYWKERLRKYTAKVEALKELIASQLDEKRNFMSFMLTIITTILAPLAILTGYFGMNFDNMKELDHTTYRSAPGVQLMWIICGVCYGALLLVAFHFRVLYSAT